VPELPEAEAIVRGLRSTVVGERIRRTRVLHADVLRQPRRTFGPHLRGRQIVAVQRRGKNVIHRLDDDSVLAVNLGMTGRLLPFSKPPRGAARPTHAAVRFSFGSGGTLIFDDQRRFGTVEHLTAGAWQDRSRRMGPEPLDPFFTAKLLHQALSRSRSPVRSWLLDQRRIAGVGNIYAAEVLHLAGVHPLRRANEVTASEARRLREGLKQVLQDAIDHGGTTIRDYRDAEGKAGNHARWLRVYGREGQPCHACGASVARVVLSRRSAYFCPGCQPHRRRSSA
jgi:formamidopyrimidine-DNA glycosylase